MKIKLVGAKKGHSLLKKKADALTMRMRSLLKQIMEVCAARCAGLRRASERGLRASSRGSGSGCDPAGVVVRRVERQSGSARTWLAGRVWPRSLAAVRAVPTRRLVGRLLAPLAVR